MLLCSKSQSVHSPQTCLTGLHQVSSSAGLNGRPKKLFGPFPSISRQLASSAAALTELSVKVGKACRASELFSAVENTIQIILGLPLAHGRTSMSAFCQHSVGHAVCPQLRTYHRLFSRLHRTHRIRKTCIHLPSSRLQALKPVSKNNWHRAYCMPPPSESQPTAG